MSDLNGGTSDLHFKELSNEHCSQDQKDPAFSQVLGRLLAQLSTLPGFSENPFVVGLLRAEEQQMPITATTVQQQQYRTKSP